MHKGEQVSVEEFPGLINICSGGYRTPVLKCDGRLQSLAVCLSELSDSLVLGEFSENGEKFVLIPNPNNEV